jgi:hypothetical protein
MEKGVILDISILVFSLVLLVPQLILDLLGNKK